MRLSLPLVAVLVVVGCSKQAVDLAGLACADGECARGYACHPETGICVPEVVVGCDGEGLCPSEVQAGDACPTDGSFIPCVDGATDCDDGCRTCVDGAWSDTCPDPCMPDGGELCDGRDNDCNGEIDDLTQAAVDLECADPSAHAASWACIDGSCVVASCETGYWNIDTGDDDCEYPCTLTAGGDETCDGLDNDCNGGVDDVEDVDVDCNLRLGNPSGADHFLCDPAPCGSYGCCSIASCDPGFLDTDGNPTNGCEAVCAPSNPGPEVCDGEDNDCDGTPDNPSEPGATDCIVYFRDHDQDGAGADGDSECWCAPTGEYVVTSEGDCDDDDGDVFDGASEVCDGKDNDCDAGTPDGDDEPDIGVDCDGADTDACLEGTWTCDGVSLVCSDTTADDVEGPIGDETCDDNQDNDCDTFEDLDDPACCGWPYQKTITIDPSRVAGSGGALPHFPVLVQLIADADLAAHVSDANGDDLLFRAEDATTCGATTPPCDLDYELEVWDDGAGTLIAWVRVPRLSQDSETVLHLLYGNPCVAGPGENPTGVWDDGFAAVWHLDGLEDSTENGNDGGNSGSADSSALIGRGRSFDGSNDHIEVDDDGTLDLTGALTLEAWANLASATDNQKLVGKTGIGDGYLLGVAGGVYPEIWNSSGVIHGFAVGTYAASEWVHFAVTWTTNGSMIGYINGAEVHRIDAGAQNIGTNNDRLDIGCAPWDHGAFVVDGILDEVRVSNIARTPDWLQTSVNNQRWPDKADDDANGFYTVSAEL